MNGSVLENNIFIGSANLGTGIVQQHNYFLGAPTGFQDANNNNFQLAPGSATIDAGMLVPPYTDGYAGAAPDQGAYEYSRAPFASSAR